MIYGNIERECEYIRKQATAIASRHNMGREWGEDRASECVLNWLKSRGGLCEGSAFEGYAIRMIENEIADWFRLKSSSEIPCGGFSAASQKAHNPEQDIVTGLERDLQIARMKARGEDTSTLDIVELRAGGFTIPEIAEKLGMKRKTADSKLRRAQAAARRASQGYPH